MSKTNLEIIAAKLPIRLTPEEMEAPKEALRDFFRAIDLNSSREILWQMVCVYMHPYDDDISFEVDRSDVLTFYKEVEKLIEACFWMVEKEESI